MDGGIERGRANMRTIVHTSPSALTFGYGRRTNCYFFTANPTASVPERRSIAVQRRPQEGTQEEKLMPISVRAVIALVLVAGGLSHAAADEVADFYRGRQIQVVIGHEVGGGYDVYGRLVGRFMSKHLPGNPRVIAQNMVGAGGRKAANWLYGIASRDGSVIGVTAQTTPLDQALKQEGVAFDASRFNWIGNPIIDNQIFFAWHTTGIKSLEDAVAKGGLICGGTGASTNPATLPKIINYMVGSNIRVVMGYPSANNVLLAMERSEVNCIGSHSWSTAKVTVAHHLRENKLNMPVQWGPSKDPEISQYAKREVPLMYEYARTDVDRAIVKLMSSGMAIGRPLYAPPGVPPVRVAALRKAFDDIMKDPEFLAEAKKSNADIRPMSGAELQAIATEVVRTPPEIATKLISLLQ
jgi:tripartite-type tricarboxylate transporter receptor subunit TctC